jgi:hypothetical protein
MVLVYSQQRKLTVRTNTVYNGASSISQNRVSQIRTQNPTETMSLSSNMEVEPQCPTMLPVAQPRQNDVILEQSWNNQDLSLTVKNAISTFASLYWRSPTDQRLGVIAAAADRLKCLGVKILSFDSKTNQSAIVADESAIENFILEAFAQHDPSAAAAVAQGERRDERELIPVSTPFTGESKPSETLVPTSDSKEIVDLAPKKNEDAIAPVEAITPCDVQYNTARPNLHVPQNNVLLQQENAIPADTSQLLPTQIHRVCAGQQHDQIATKEIQCQQGMDSRHAQCGIQAAHQSSGERTDQCVTRNPVTLPQQSVEVGEKPPQHPPPLELPAAPGASTLPASFANTYADYFEYVNMADLHFKRPEDMLGWQFFPMQLTQSLRDLPLINEWKIVVAPLNSSSGQAFCIDL